jgi:hypothetical protein
MRSPTMERSSRAEEPDDFAPLGSIILISWSEVQFLESFDLPMTSNAGDR